MLLANRDAGKVIGSLLVIFEKASKGVLGLGTPDATFIARGEQNFARLAAVDEGHLKGRAG
jgi:glutathione S-transferase